MPRTVARAYARRGRACHRHDPIIAMTSLLLFSGGPVRSLDDMIFKGIALAPATVIDLEGG